jgi:hypothetical protein
MTTRQVQAEEPSQRPPNELRQERPEQQPAVGEHACPLDEQVAPLVHEPTVLPWGTAQLRPEQQSALVVHRPVSGWHTAGATQVPLEQMPEQH